MYPLMITLAAMGFLGPVASAREDHATTTYRDQIQPILEERCYSCHGNGLKKGGLSLDASDPELETKLLKDRAVWSAVLENVRAGMMPPSEKPRIPADEARKLATWIKSDVFGIDPKNPDPGRVTLRRLNRAEYRNTIRDLMGIDFRTDEEFPPDDTGYGFDNVGDVLTISPLLLEKYFEAAEAIVAKAVPTVSKSLREIAFEGASFRGASEKVTGSRQSFYEKSEVSRTIRVEHEGNYRFLLAVEVDGEFEFDPGRCEVAFKVDGIERFVNAFGWDDNKKYRFEPEVSLGPGEHQLAFEIRPLVPVEKKIKRLEFLIDSVRLAGPIDERGWIVPKNYERFFFQGAPPKNPEARRAYARAILDRFAARAYRRPVEPETIDRLMRLVPDLDNEEFEKTVARAFVAVLASPRFLFRVERIGSPDKTERFPLVDEYALASRLAYFLWSTMPDEELIELAASGELRKNLAKQVERMLKDEKSQALIRNFVGQWLQVRDIDGIAINAALVLARDKGDEKELERERQAFRAQLENPKAQPKRPPRFFAPRIELDGALRRAMREESEQCFGYIVKDDRSILELVDADYTFANERLAKHYGLPDVKGTEMRKVSLPSGHFRGGVLTQGAVLVVTSNPTRTSPVKRGLFLLDNLLGTPPPPPPADVPPLEDAEKAVAGHEPTMRESMVVHRSKPLCASCHARMDPLGLALENFNAMGMFRETERGQAIDPSGKLLTGESFKDIRDIKRVLAHERRLDVYRCLTEKLLTYALGRGIEDVDTEAVDQIVDRLETHEGKFSILLTGVIDSAPFQKTRRIGPPASDAPEISSRSLPKPEPRHEP